MIRARIDEPSGPATEPIKPHGCNHQPTVARKGHEDFDRQMTPESDRRVTPVTCRDIVVLLGERSTPTPLTARRPAPRSG
ncbi:hypothetical protein ROHU_005937 [Labeo rohita]|uniref:Uncharacterized protein n=1 Tax=Labeo rohita TaxID=84645 RepID=A0A498N0X1_LABRO|nr:hypothetical protein ROHU_005937 [Labeo rohita]